MDKKTKELTAEMAKIPGSSLTFWTDAGARWGEPIVTRIMNRIRGNIVFDVMLSLVLVGYASPPARAQAPASATVIAKSPNPALVGSLRRGHPGAASPNSTLAPGGCLERALK